MQKPQLPRSAAKAREYCEEEHCGPQQGTETRFDGGHLGDRGKTTSVANVVAASVAFGWTVLVVQNLVGYGWTNRFCVGISNHYEQTFLTIEIVGPSTIFCGMLLMILVLKKTYHRP